MPSELSFMSLKVHLATKQEVLAATESADKEHPIQIATINPEFVLEADKNPAFKTALSEMTYAVVDGSGLYFALQLGRLFKEDISRPNLYHGADLVEDLFRRHQHGEKRFFLLGGPPGLAEDTQQSLKVRYPNLKIVGATDGGTISQTVDSIDPELAKTIEAAKPDILLVGFGAPKQELWIQAASKTLKIPIMIGVGGTFGFYSNKKRAPRSMRILHLEWLYRGITEPGHWKRVFQATVVFPFQALGWLFSTTSLRGKDRK